MNKQDKETAKNKFMEMTEQNWTWARLTKEEKCNFCKVLDWVKVSGSFLQRWQQLQNIYFAFLEALNYKSIGWRE